LPEAVTALVLVGFDPRPHPWPARIDAALDAWCDGGESWAAARFSKMYSPRWFVDHSGQAAEERARIEALDPTAVTGLARADAHRPDARELLAKLSTPTLWISGASDATVASASPAEIAAVADGRICVETVAGTGHMLPEETPGILAAAITDHIDITVSRLGSRAD
jgi:pimeloyl-ACP methyl ester carboxylesterase